MSGFVLHPDAYADLQQIWDYIAADSRNVATRVLEEIYQVIRALVRSPHIGDRRPDLASEPLRFHPVRDFLIALRARGEAPTHSCDSPRATQSAANGSFAARSR